jgi:glycosyltransferase involved in cell wall biosynthesis
MVQQQSQFSGYFDVFGTRRPLLDSPPSAKDRRRWVLIWTRDLDEERMAGRLRVARAARAALASAEDATSIRLPSAVSDWSFRRFLSSALALAGSLLRGRPLPLQCAIFAAGADIRSAIEQIPADTDAVYLDGVRTFPLLQRLRRARPDLRIIVDLDDLMSRRMDLLLSVGQPLSPGYLTLKLPGFLRNILTSDTLGRLIVLYEHAALKGAERDMLSLADSVVLLASEDALALRIVGRALKQSRAEIVTVPPGVEPVREPPAALSPPLRFIFIGTDTLTQNRLTIDYLLEVWTRLKPAAPLVIYGIQTRKPDPPAGVSFPGYAERLDDIYDGRSVLLTPSFLRGGVKTKVLEAMAWGAPVVGNRQTFESMALPHDYPLITDDPAELDALVLNPEAYSDRLLQAARMGGAYIRKLHDPAVFARRWVELMRGDPHVG